jgi:hypothetical protein
MAATDMTLVARRVGSALARCNPVQLSLAMRLGAVAQSFASHLYVLFEIVVWAVFLRTAEDVGVEEEWCRLRSDERIVSLEAEAVLLVKRPRCHLVGRS